MNDQIRNVVTLIVIFVAAIVFFKILTLAVSIFIKLIILAIIVGALFLLTKALSKNK